MKCKDCKKAKATIRFSDDLIMSITHGWGVILLCKSCYIKRVKAHIKDCEENLKELENDKDN